MMYITSVFAQLEREVIAERIRDNLLELSKTGIWLGGDPPLGFKAVRYEKIEICEEVNNQVIKKNKKASKLIINDSEINILKLIFDKFKKLKSLTKLESYLINKNIKTRKGTNYSISALKLILTNPVYVKNDKDVLNYFKKRKINIYCENDARNEFDGKYGFLTYNKTNNKKKVSMNEWIIAVGLHPGIIDGKEWIAIQNLIEKNKDKRYRSIGKSNKQSIVSGLIYCKNCNSPMRAKNIDRKRKDGTVNYSYCCTLKEKSRGVKCKSKNIKGEELDNKIIDIIKEIKVPKFKIYNELKKLFIMNDNSNNKQLKYTYTYDLLNILENSSDVYNYYDLKTKKNIASLFIERIYSNNDNIEIKFKHKKIEENEKNIYMLTSVVDVSDFLNTYLSSDNISKITLKE